MDNIPEIILLVKNMTFLETVLLMMKILLGLVVFAIVFGFATSLYKKFSRFGSKMADKMLNKLF